MNQTPHLEMINDLTEDYSVAPKYATVDLLLGNPHNLMLAPDQTIVGPTEDLPIAVKTKLGTCLSGNLNPDRNMAAYNTATKESSTNITKANTKKSRNANMNTLGTVTNQPPLPKPPPLLPPINVRAEANTDKSDNTDAKTKEATNKSQSTIVNTKANTENSDNAQVNTTEVATKLPPTQAKPEANTNLSDNASAIAIEAATIETAKDQQIDEVDSLMEDAKQVYQPLTFAQTLDQHLAQWMTTDQISIDTEDRPGNNEDLTQGELETERKIKASKKYSEDDRQYTVGLSFRVTDRPSTNLRMLTLLLRRLYKDLEIKIPSYLSIF